jgi:hypothetical protein
VLRSTPGVDFVGCVDHRPERSRETAAEHGATAFATLAAMLEAVDAVSVVTTTSAHAEVALAALAAQKDGSWRSRSLWWRGERVVPRRARCSRSVTSNLNGAVEAVFPRIGCCSSKSIAWRRSRPAGRMSVAWT